MRINKIKRNGNIYFPLVFLATVMIYFSFLLLPINAKNCSWTQAEKNDTSICQRKFGQNGKTWNQTDIFDYKKSSSTYSVLCCEEQISKKISIIGSVIGFFLLITVLTLFYKKNE